MSIFGSSEKKVEEKTTFNFDIDKENINQSNLAKDIKINGSIEAKDYIDFAGHITGTIKSSTIYLKSNSYVKGTITGDTITIEGEVDGDIHAKDLHIKSTAKIKGNIRYNNIDIQNGSIINAELFYSS
jgi:cytoskeletal protein CcmA (bactofilin family)